MSRLFKIKLKSLLNDLIEKQILGKVCAHIYVIEFQKRGLPHAHILIVLDECDKIKSAEQVDVMVSAEIPNKEIHKLAYETVTTSMMHGPCGVGYPDAPCMKDGKCSKGYPKTFQSETFLANDKYPVYRRRADGNFVVKKGFILDNRWVVPHNLYLSTKYNAHINVEICNTIGAVKYLFKYVYKGSDKATFSLEKPDLEPQNSKTNDNITTNNNHDEIKKFLDARYVGAPEAVWRSLGFNMTEQNPHTVRLPVHLPEQ